MNKEGQKNLSNFFESIKMDSTVFRRKVVDALATCFNYTHANYFVFSENGEARDPVQLNITNRYLPDYFEHYHKLDILHPYNVRYSLQRNVISITDSLPYKQYEQSEFYMDFLKKMNLFDGVGIAQFDFLGKMVGWLCLWKTDKEKFHTEDIELFKIIGAYLQKESIFNCFSVDGENKADASNLSLDCLDKGLPLTGRELEILAFVLKGYTNEEIAKELFLSIYTVKTHMRNIFRKTSASNRTALCYQVSKGRQTG